MRNFVIRHVCGSVSLPCIGGFASYKNPEWHASRKLRKCKFIMNDDDDDELLVLSRETANELSLRLGTYPVYDDFVHQDDP